jgi:hypothetical protein
MRAIHAFTPPPHALPIAPPHKVSNSLVGEHGAEIAAEEESENLRRWSNATGSIETLDGSECKMWSVETLHLLHLHCPRGFTIDNGSSELAQILLSCGISVGSGYIIGLRLDAGDSTPMRKPKIMFRLGPLQCIFLSHEDIACVRGDALYRSSYDTSSDRAIAWLRSQPCRGRYLYLHLCLPSKAALSTHQSQHKMAPHAMQDQPAGVPHVSTPKRENATQDMRKPVQATGVLDSLAYEDLTPAIGRAFENVNIIDDTMNAENANDRLRELALISK